jgi:hypothetical protein
MNISVRLFKAPILSMIKLSLYPLRKVLFFILSPTARFTWPDPTKNKNFEDLMLVTLLCFSSTMDLQKYELLLIKIEILLSQYFLSHPRALSSLLRVYGCRNYLDKKYLLNTQLYRFWKVLPPLLASFTTIFAPLGSIPTAGFGISSLALEGKENTSQLTLLELSLASSQPEATAMPTATATATAHSLTSSPPASASAAAVDREIQISPYEEKILSPLVEQYMSLIIFFTDLQMIKEVLALRLTCRDCFHEKRFPFFVTLPPLPPSARDGDAESEGSLLSSPLSAIPPLPQLQKGIVLSEKGLIESFLGGSMSMHVPTIELLRHQEHLKHYVVRNAKYWD